MSTSRHRNLKSIISELEQRTKGDPQSDDIFKRAFDTSPIGIALVSPDGKFLEINNALSKILGYSASNLKKKTFQDLTHPEDLQKDLSLLRQTLKGTIDTYQMTKRYFHRDKHIVWALLSVAAIRDETGVVQVFLSQIEDVSQRVEYEEKLMTERNEYQVIADNVSDMISKHDSQGIYQYVSSSTKQLMGYETKELIGKSAYDFFHPDDIERIQTFHRKIGDTTKKNSELVDYRIRRKDGTYVFVQSKIRGIFVDGRLESIIVVTRDMDEEKRTAIELEEKENKYHLLLNNLPVRVYYKDLHSIYQRCNLLFAQDLGIDPDNIIGKRDSDLFPEEYVQKYHTSDSLVIRTGRRFESIEEFVSNKKILPVRSVKVPIRDQDKIIGILGLFWDISEEQRLQEDTNQKIDQLSKMNVFFANREMRMVELKKENALLREKLEHIK